MKKTKDLYVYFKNKSEALIFYLIKGESKSKQNFIYLMMKPEIYIYISKIK